MDFSIGKPWLPSGNDCYIAIENGPVEIVDLPIDSMVIFHSCVNVYQRVNPDVLTSQIPFNKFQRLQIGLLLTRAWTSKKMCFYVWHANWLKIIWSSILCHGNPNIRGI